MSREDATLHASLYWWCATCQKTCRTCALGAGEVGFVQDTAPFLDHQVKDDWGCLWSHAMLLREVEVLVDDVYVERVLNLLLVFSNPQTCMT